LRVEGSGFRIEDLGFNIQGSGFGGFREKGEGVRDARDRGLAR